MKTILILLTAAIFILGGFYFWSNRTVKPVMAPIEEMDSTITMPTPVETTSNEVIVRMKDMKYVPDKITVKEGTTVTWINEDDMEHNAMLDHENSDDSHHASSAGVAGEFSGPMLKKGEKYSYTFNVAGVNGYHCAPHPWMTGTVTVIQ